MRRLVILGAGERATNFWNPGRCQPRQPGYRLVGLLDNNKTIGVEGEQILGGYECLGSIDADYEIGVDSPPLCHKLGVQADNHGHEAAGLVYSPAWVDSRAYVGLGALIAECSHIQHGSTVGKHVVVNINAIVGHDCHIGNYSALAGSVMVGALARIGNEVLLGTNSVLMGDIMVVDRTVIGAGAVVTRNVPPVTCVVESLSRTGSLRTPFVRRYDATMQAPSEESHVRVSRTKGSIVPRDRSHDGPSEKSIYPNEETMSGCRIRKVCLFTGSRADYSPLYPLAYRLHVDPGVDLRILASGGHLVPSQGLTVREIEADGFNVDDCVEVVLESDSANGVSKSFGLACIGYADALRKISPDIVIVPGDRYEALAVAIVASQSLIPVIHIGGGQLTYGSTDEKYRHAITKLSDIHFTITGEDRDRLVQMGEDPERVYEVGPLGVDAVDLADMVSRSEIENSIGLKLSTPTFLVTYHAVSEDPTETKRTIGALLEALDGYPNATVVFTAPNVDAGRAEIRDRMQKYAENRTSSATIVSSLGRRRYLSLMKHADLVIGNSSSGINEAPLIGTPTVNIGTRQDGRQRASSVVDCRGETGEILTAIDKALVMRRSSGDGMARQSTTTMTGLDVIVDVLKSIQLDRLRRKKFWYAS